jgi:hypothetical protein
MNYIVCNPVHVVLPISFSFFKPKATTEVTVNIRIILWSKMPNSTTKFCNIYIIMRKFDQAKSLLLLVKYLSPTLMMKGYPLRTNCAIQGTSIQVCNFPTIYWNVGVIMCMLLIFFI